MSQKSGLTPLFSDQYIQDITQNFAQEQVNKVIAVLLLIGENFVNKAKERGEYEDDTGNLRTSIGFMILNNGVLINSKFNHTNTEGKLAAFAQADVLKKEYSKGIVLVGFAGMNYAAAVEAKGYDVISGSAPTKEIMIVEFKKFLT